MKSAFVNKQPVSIKLYDASLTEEWNNYISKNELSTLGHHLGWKTVVESTYGHQSYYLMAFRGNNVTGVLPLFLIKSLLFGRVLVTSPFLTYGGILYDDDDTATALINYAKDIAIEKNVKYTEYKNIQCSNLLVDTKTKYFTLILDLSEGEEKIWTGKLHPTARRNVRKASKEKLTIIDNNELIDEYYKINCINMKRLGTPAHSMQFFKNVIKHIPETTLLMAEYNRTYIGGMLLARFKDTCHMPWVASNPEYLQKRPNNLLYWEAIRHACKSGMHYMDFGRSKMESGTYEFKKQHGALPKQLYYQYHLNSVNEMPDMDPDAASFKALVRIWQSLPIQLTNIISPHIIKNIP